MADHATHPVIAGSRDAGRYTITWHCGVAKIEGLREVISLGVCEYSGGVAFIAVYDPNRPVTSEFLKTITIHDIYIENGICSDGRFCMNLSCPYNRADIGYFKKKYGLTRKMLEKLHKIFENIREDLNLEVKEHGMAVYYKKPAVIFQRQA